VVRPPPPPPPQPLPTLFIAGLMLHESILHYKEFSWHAHTTHAFALPATHPMLLFKLSKQRTSLFLLFLLRVPQIDQPFLLVTDN
jgi:hypothetical protein